MHITLTFYPNNFQFDIFFHSGQAAHTAAEECPTVYSDREIDFSATGDQQFTRGQHIVGYVTGDTNGNRHFESI